MNTRPSENGKNVQEGQEKKKYRLNKRKFSAAMSVLCILIAGIVIAVHYVRENGGREAIAAVNPPQKTTAASSGTINERPDSLEGKTIIVDAGHGGVDPGASGINGSVESELNLEIAKSLKAQLESKGAKVVMTRSTDKLADTKDEDWEKRDEIISGSGADLLVSIHLNSFFDDTSVSGPLVLFLTGSEQGKTLADTIQQSMNEYLQPETQGDARGEDLKILKYGYQPSVLVECGYISNAKEEENLNKEDYQKSIAEAICSGVIAFFNG